MPAPETLHRRGMIMGLTVAEAFMLIAFVLLMLLVLWRHELQTEYDELLAKFISIDITTEKLMELNKKADLVDEPVLQDIAKASRNLPLEQKRTLAEFLSRSEADVLIEKTSNLRDVLHERSAEEIKKALELRDELDPYGEENNDTIKEKINHLASRKTSLQNYLAEKEKAHRDLVLDLQENLGKQIAQHGGKIDPSGKIVFPETVFFASGKYDILPDSDPAEFLNDFCPGWLNTLRESKSQNEISDLLIEGHSSSGWSKAETPREAWIKNLWLSQRRARSVLVYCLNLIEQTPLEDWSRAKLAAVGYSSSRTMPKNGPEDPQKSRRVVFGYSIKHEQLLEEIGDDIADKRQNIGTLRGVASVIDGDTIEIRGHAVRLEGIDAFEKDQMCTRADGTTYNCGHEATRAVEKYIDGKQVTCGNLRVGLRRFLGLCHIGGENLNRWVVREGWALAYLKYSQDYLRDENKARADQRGVWAGEPPIPPWQWRREKWQ